MAVQKNRLLRKNASNGYDTVYLETDASMVTGVLPVNKGGTGVTKIEDLGKILVDSGVVSGSGSGMEVAIGVGTTVNWAGYTWTVVHVSGGKTYLALNEIRELCQFNSNGSTAYSGSNLAARAMAFQNSLPAAALEKAVNTTVNGVTAKIFVCSYEQANGGFDYFKDNGSRICKYNGTAQWWWTSSPDGSGGVWGVSTDGGLNYGSDPTYSVGFRPFVALNS